MALSPVDGVPSSRSLAEGWAAQPPTCHMPISRCFGRAVVKRYLAAGRSARRAQPGEDLFSALCQARTPDGEAFNDADVINRRLVLASVPVGSRK